MFHSLEEWVKNLSALVVLHHKTKNWLRYWKARLEQICYFIPRPGTTVNLSEVVHGGWFLSGGYDLTPIEAAAHDLVSSIRVTVFFNKQIHHM